MFLSINVCNAQYGYWQQRVEYFMNIDMNVKNYKFQGEQKLIYYNNSPDTLYKVFYHLYFNAFQNGSMMHARQHSLGRFGNKRMVSKLDNIKDNEIGYQKIKSLSQDGKKLKYQIEGTILEVELNNPIAPNSKTTFDMVFEGQVPIQIRRSGRNSREDVALSMTQWYPKMVEYDFEGWHPNPYIGREFHGVWGDFDVKIKIDKEYTIGGSGLLLNADDIGHGYVNNFDESKLKNKDKLTWHFKAENIHDFAWAADPDFIHKKTTVPNGPTLHFIHKDNSMINRNWEKAMPVTVKFFEFMKENVGAYPYKQYTIVQGGDGGMEYGMTTLITGEREFSSLIGVIYHEAAHSWFQHILATNESKYAWMDEGFTSYISDLGYEKILGKSNFSDIDFIESNYQSYVHLANSSREEPLCTHADHFNSNYAYGIGSYTKGLLFLPQLEYIIGEKPFANTLKNFYETWKFKHPTDKDFERIAEKESGMNLDWYFSYWIHSTHTIDYSLESLIVKNKKTTINIKRKGKMPMPLDILVTYKDGTKELFYIPLRIMRGEKQNDTKLKRNILKDWPWTHNEYSFDIYKNIKDIKSLQIDPDNKMCDIDRTNNILNPSKADSKKNIFSN